MWLFFSLAYIFLYFFLFFVSHKSRNFVHILITDFIPCVKVFIILIVLTFFHFCVLEILYGFSWVHAYSWNWYFLFLFFVFCFVFGVVLWYVVIFPFYFYHNCHPLNLFFLMLLMVPISFAVRLSCSLQNVLNIINIFYYYLYTFIWFFFYNTQRRKNLILTQRHTINSL